MNLIQLSALKIYIVFINNLLYSSSTEFGLYCTFIDSV